MILLILLFQIVCDVTMALDCGSPGIPFNGLANAIGNIEPNIRFPPGAVVSYSCQEPHQVLREPTQMRHCQDSGKWTGYRPWCDSNLAFGRPLTIYNKYAKNGSALKTFQRKRSHCVHVSPGTYANIDLGEHFAVHTIILHFKNTDREIKGQMFIDHHRCGKANQTDNLISYQCMVQNHGVDNSNSNRGRFIRFHNLQHPVSICDVEVYQNPQHFECGSPEVPADGRVEIAQVNESLIAKYECNENYELIGDERRICHERHWQGEQPVCEPPFRRSLIDFPFVGRKTLEIIVGFSIVTGISLALSLSILLCLIKRKSDRAAKKRVLGSYPLYWKLEEQDLGSVKSDG